MLRWSRQCRMLYATPNPISQVLLYLNLLKKYIKPYKVNNFKPEIIWYNNYMFNYCIIGFTCLMKSNKFSDHKKKPFY